MCLNRKRSPQWRPKPGISLKEPCRLEKGNESGDSQETRCGEAGGTGSGDGAGAGLVGAVVAGGGSSRGGREDGGRNTASRANGGGGVDRPVGRVGADSGGRGSDLRGRRSDLAAGGSHHGGCGGNGDNRDLGAALERAVGHGSSALGDGGGPVGGGGESGGLIRSNGVARGGNAGAGESSRDSDDTDGETHFD